MLVRHVTVLFHSSLMLPCQLLASGLGCVGTNFCAEETEDGCPKEKQGVSRGEARAELICFLQSLFSLLFLLWGSFMLASTPSSPFYPSDAPVQATFRLLKDFLEFLLLILETYTFSHVYCFFQAIFTRDPRSLCYVTIRREQKVLGFSFST